MTKKFRIPVCPHAGGVGLSEYVHHLSIFDYIYVSASLESRILEYVDHLHENFLDPVKIQSGRYMPPEMPGCSIEMKTESLDEFEFPMCRVWYSILPRAGNEPSPLGHLKLFERDRNHTQDDSERSSPY